MQEEHMLPLQVQVRRRETARQTEIRVQSHAYLRQREQDEMWVDLAPFMPDDDEARARRISSPRREPSRAGAR